MSFLLLTHAQGPGSAALPHTSEHNKIMCCTKNPAMAKLLHDLDFKITKWPGFWTNFVLTINTFRRLISMIIRLDFKRIWLQGKNILNYDQFEIIRD